MPADEQRDIHFPKAGIDVSKHAGRWPLRMGPNNEKHYTCAVGVNVRGFDTIAKRFRGGSRPGLSQFVPDPVVSDFIVQGLRTLVGTGYDPPGGGMPQPSQSGRIVTVIAVAEGNIYVANPGDTTWTTPTNNAASPPLLDSGIILSASIRQKQYFADGNSWIFYDPFENEVNNWVASAGILPEDDDGNAPRLICTWRGRCVLSGLIRDPQNIFMSKVDDPTDFDYSPLNPSPLDAIALNLSDLGLIGDVVTGLAPLTDDVLVVFGDHTIYKITGDPLAGGVIDNISKSIGAAWGEAFCSGPDGTLYFFSNIPGVYALPPMASGQPVRISTAIDPLLEDVNTGTNSIHMQWDEEGKGIHLFITPLAGSAAATHYFFEAPRPDGSGNAWWQVVYANNDHNPLVSCTVDGNESDDRSVLTGSWDGYVRKQDPTATSDDGTPIASRVLLGPFLTPNMDEIGLQSLQAVFGDDSADVSYGILLGRTAEQALQATAVATGTFSELRGFTKQVRRSAHALYVELTSTGRWAMESIRAGFWATVSAVRRRGKS